MASGTRFALFSGAQGVAMHLFADMCKMKVNGIFPKELHL
jgi:hypothetical protein